METITIEKPEVKTKETISAEIDSATESKEVDPALVAQADEIMNRLLSVGEQDLVAKKKLNKSVSTIGYPIQTKLAKQSEILKAPMATLMKDAQDGGQVANGLLSLQEQVNSINPNKVDFTMSSVRRFLSKIPGVGTPMSRWFAKYQAVDTVINDIIGQLKDGKAQLERDNTTLTDDQLRMRELIIQLQEYIQLAQLLDKKLSDVVASMAETDAKRAFLEEEILFPLKQRIVDLQQQLAVNQQGVLATEVIIRNNFELVKGVNRSLNVTVTALNTAATLQVALQHQKKVLKGVQAVTDTTNELIAGTAEQLKTQGVEVQKQATKTTLDIEVLKKAFSDVEEALHEISTFRREALPQMAQSIVEMNDVTSSMEETIMKYEKGNEITDDDVFEIIDKS